MSGNRSNSKEIILIIEAFDLKKFHILSPSNSHKVQVDGIDSFWQRK